MFQRNRQIFHMLHGFLFFPSNFAISFCQRSAAFPRVWQFANSDFTGQAFFWSIILLFLRLPCRLQALTKADLNVICETPAVNFFPGVWAEYRPTVARRHFTAGSTSPSPRGPGSSGSAGCVFSSSRYSAHSFQSTKPSTISSLRCRYNTCILHRNNHESHQLIISSLLQLVKMYLWILSRSISINRKTATM